MYSVFDYGTMIADSVRMRAYHAALKATVKPGDTVLDIGAGTGIFSMLACQFGAEHVYAIEISDVIHVAREIARDNGLADRITFLQQDSKKVSLPRQADVIVSDIRGRLPIMGDNISTLMDARDRHMQKGGAFIPKRDTLWCAVTQSEKKYGYFTEPWGEYDLDMRAAEKRAVNTQSSIDFESIDALTSSTGWAELDYSVIASANVAGDAAMTVEKPGAGHGLVVGFETELQDGIGYSNAPELDPSERSEVYGQSFFPWPEAVELESGDRVEVSLKANLVHGEYVWSWDSRIIATGEADRVKAAFRQSTFFNAAGGIEQLRKKAVDFRPELSADGEVSRVLLSLMDGSSSLQEIAEALYRQFPEEFTSGAEALARVSQWSGRYAK